MPTSATTTNYQCVQGTTRSKGVPRIVRVRQESWEGHDGAFREGEPGLNRRRTPGCRVHPPLIGVQEGIFRGWTQAGFPRRVIERRMEWIRETGNQMPTWTRAEVLDLTYIILVIGERRRGWATWLVEDRGRALPVRWVREMRNHSFPFSVDLLKIIQSRRSNTLAHAHVPDSQRTATSLAKVGGLGIRPSGRWLIGGGNVDCGLVHRLQVRSPVDVDGQIVRRRKFRSRVNGSRWIPLLPSKQLEIG